MHDKFNALAMGQARIFIVAFVRKIVPAVDVVIERIAHDKVAPKRRPPLRIAPPTMRQVLVRSITAQVRPVQCRRIGNSRDKQTGSGGDPNPGPGNHHIPKHDTRPFEFQDGDRAELRSSPLHLYHFMIEGRKPLRPEHIQSKRLNKCHMLFAGNRHIFSPQEIQHPPKRI